MSDHYTCVEQTADLVALRFRRLFLVLLVLSRSAAIRLFGFATLLLLARSNGVSAFPLLDVTDNQVPLGTGLASPDAQDLRHQLRLADGLAAPPGGGWSFIPRLDWQEELTDNVLQEHAPRRPDLVTFVAPGIGIAADLPRLRLTFDFAPTLALYGRSGDLNSLTEQMNGLGNITLVPELAFVDVRAVAGLHSLNGGLGGLGSLGSAAFDSGPSQASIPNLAGNTLGLNKNNEVQTSSLGISVRPNGAVHQWRKDPPRELSVGPGSRRATCWGNLAGRSLVTKAAVGRSSNPAGRNASEA